MRVLTTVKTYPTPSASYDELVCTAGIVPDLGFIRLFPVQFRQMPFERQYQKYQWLSVAASPNPSDPRPDSYRPVQDSIQPEGEPLPAGDWAERKRIVLPYASESLEELQARRDEGGPSLGIFKPAEVLDFTWEATEREWTNQQRDQLTRRNLFGRDLAPLRKIPYDFRYRFRCDDSRCRGNHHIKIIDWELGVLFLKMQNEHGEEAALGKVREKFLGQLCGPNTDTYLYMGTTHVPYEAWLVLGVFYPPQETQHRLLQ